MSAYSHTAGCHTIWVYSREGEMKIRQALRVVMMYRIYLLAVDILYPRVLVSW